MNCSRESRRTDSVHNIHTLKNLAEDDLKEGIRRRMHRTRSKCLHACHPTNS